MEEQKTIKDYIVDYLLDGEDEKRLDPVLVEWLAEDDPIEKNLICIKRFGKNLIVIQKLRLSILILLGKRLTR